MAALHERGVRVVDLSADFRLRLVEIYEHWYGTHPHPELLGEAVYGLPELHRAQIAGADIVANPGCFPTAALLAWRRSRRRLADVVIDAKTGVSGAGRAPIATTHFVTVDDDRAPYDVAGHRHTPEIEQELALPGCAVRVRFVPHLVPLDQGELVSCYGTLRERGRRRRAVRRRLRPGAVRRGRRRPARHARRARPNFCRIHAHVDERTPKVVVFAAIDNLWKGTASQAVQNLNVMFDLPETVGLL